MEKQIWYIHTVEFIDKKEWSRAIYYNMDEPWKHYAKWKKPVIIGPYYMIPFV